MTKKPGKAARSPGTILVVDPDGSIRKSARALLESLGYRVLDASDAAGAVQIATLYVGPIHVLLIEADLPGAGGQPLAERLGSLHPELRVLFTSARAHKELAGLPFIRKPLERDRLALKLRGVLGDSR